MYCIFNVKCKVARLCIDQKKSSFFLIHTKQAKELLISKAKDLVTSILDKICQLCQQNVEMLEAR